MEIFITFLAFLIFLQLNGVGFLLVCLFWARVKSGCLQSGHVWWSQWVLHLLRAGVRGLGTAQQVQLDWFSLRGVLRIFLVLTAFLGPNVSPHHPQANRREELGVRGARKPHKGRQNCCRRSLELVAAAWEAGRRMGLQEKAPVRGQDLYLNLLWVGFLLFVCLVVGGLNTSRQVRAHDLHCLFPFWTLG